MQTSILLLFLFLTAAATVVFLWVFITSLVKQKEEGMANPLNKRFWFLLILFIVLAIFTFITIPKSPYYVFAEENPSQVVHVAARQFSFIFSDNAVDPKTQKGESSFEVEKDELVEFRVTSLDVNHGFGIYDPSHKLIAQTQAMPGYVNRLRWKFDEPGKYMILCLEFCGPVHQGMRANFTVK